MRFSLRVFLAIIGLNAILCLYFASKLPRETLVVAKMSRDTRVEVPDRIVSYRGGKILRETLAQWEAIRLENRPGESDLEARFQVLRDDVSQFGMRSDYAILKLHPAEFESQFFSQLTDTQSFDDVKRAYDAIRWMAYVGIAEQESKHKAVDYIMCRFVRELAADPSGVREWPFIADELRVHANEVEHVRYMAGNKDFVAALLSRVESGEGIPPSYYSILAFAGRLDLSRRFWLTEIKTKDSAYYVMNAIRELVKHELSDEEFDAVLEFLRRRSSEKSASGGDSRFAGDTYKAIKEHPTTDSARMDKLRECAAYLARRDSRLNVFYLKELAKVADDSDADIFRDVIAEEEVASSGGARFMSAINGMIHLGLEDDIRSTITALVESGKGVSYFEQYRKSEGENAIPFFRKTIETTDRLSVLLAAVEQLGEIGKGSKNPQLIEYLRKLLHELPRSPIQQSSPGMPWIFWDDCGMEFLSKYTTVCTLHKMGDDPDGLLWQQVPRSNSKPAQMGMFWIRRNRDYNKLIDFVNQTFQLKRPVTLDGLIEERSYPLDEAGELFRIHVIAQAALEHADEACMIDARQGTALMAFDMCKLVGEELPVRGAVEKSGVVHLVIANRVFRIATPSTASQYDSRAMIDILNAILAEYCISRRFFAYANGRHSNQYLILLTDPKVVVALRDQFGLEAESGYEYYLEH